MKVGVFSAILSQVPLEQALDHIAGLKCDCIEIGTGAYPGDAHCKPTELLADEGKLREFAAAVRERGLEISSLSCHGNPVHPDEAIARGASRRIPGDGETGGEDRRAGRHHFFRLPRR